MEDLMNEMNTDGQRNMSLEGTSVDQHETCSRKKTSNRPSEIVLEGTSFRSSSPAETPWLLVKMDVYAPHGIDFRRHQSQIGMR